MNCIESVTAFFTAWAGLVDSSAENQRVSAERIGQKGRKRATIRGRLGEGASKVRIDMKRVTDIAVSAVVLLVTTPLIIGLAIVSAIALRAWPFFVQERVGQHGKPFRFVKIRTLHTDFATYAPKTALSQLHLPVAMRLLRASHLDELPQLWLVLTGKMSLVGPRPEMAMLHDRLSPAAAAERVSVRPGLTGLWQISAHCDGLICDRTEYDRLYIRYSNALLDGWILSRTVAKVLLGRRVHLHQVPRWAVGCERPLAGAIATRTSVIDLREPAAPGSSDTTAVPERVPLPAMSAS